MFLAIDDGLHSLIITTFFFLAYITIRLLVLLSSGCKEPFPQMPCSLVSK